MRIHIYILANILPLKFLPLSLTPDKRKPCDRISHRNYKFRTQKLKQLNLLECSAHVFYLISFFLVLFS